MNKDKQQKGYRKTKTLGKKMTMFEDWLLSVTPKALVICGRIACKKNSCLRFPCKSWIKTNRETFNETKISEFHSKKQEHKMISTYASPNFNTLLKNKFLKTQVFCTMQL